MGGGCVTVCCFFSAVQREAKPRRRKIRAVKILGISSLLDEVLFTEGKEALGPEQGEKMERISLVILWLHISKRSAMGETMNLALGAAPPGGGAVSDWCNTTIQSPLRRGGDCIFFFLSFNVSTPGAMFVSCSPWIPLRRVGVCGAAAGVAVTRPDRCCFSLFKWILSPLVRTTAS